MASYTLRRNDTGELITTTSAIDANNLVANGVAKLVKDPKYTASAVKSVKAEPKADASK